MIGELVFVELQNATVVPKEILSLSPDDERFVLMEEFLKRRLVQLLLEQIVHREVVLQVLLLQGLQNTLHLCHPTLVSHCHQTEILVLRPAVAHCDSLLAQFNHQFLLLLAHVLVDEIDYVLLGYRLRKLDPLVVQRVGEQDQRGEFVHSELLGQGVVFLDLAEDDLREVGVGERSVQETRLLSLSEQNDHDFSEILLHSLGVVLRVQVLYRVGHQA